MIVMKSLDECIIIGPDNRKYRLTLLDQPQKPNTEMQLATDIQTKADQISVKASEFTGPKIRQLRKNTGISLRKFAAKVKMTHAALSLLERGETNRPHRATLRAIAHELNITLI